MTIIEKNVAELIPYQKNTKKHDKRQIDNVAESIKRYGFVQPIVIDKDNVVVIGHCRLLAAKKLKMKTVPCVLVDELTPEQVRELRIIDNKTNESPWDLPMLADEMKGLDFSRFDFDFGLYDEVTDTVVEDDYDPSQDVKPKAKYGDIFQLGDHRLMCGDSTKAEDVIRLCNGEEMDMFLTDPPYNVDYKGTAGKIQNDNMSDTAFLQFLEEAFENAKQNMRKGAAFYIWHADLQGYVFRKACAAVGLLARECLIWVKNSATLSRQDFQWKHEPCLSGENPEGDEEDYRPALYGWKGGAAHYFFRNRRQTTVLYFDKPKRSAEHPTMKPIKLFDYLMQCSTKEGDRVLDLFGGSGTAIMAAEQNGRVCYTMEYDPKFVDVIIDRWEKFTGKVARKIND